MQAMVMEADALRNMIWSGVAIGCQAPIFITVHRVAISPQWRIEGPDGRELSPRVLDLLLRIDEHGSLARACTATGVSYRHAWQLLREGEALFSQPLLVMSRGKGSALTPLGERLVWAQRRIQARLSPVLDSLASEVHAEIRKALNATPERLRIHASHGFAVQKMHEFLEREGLVHELKYCGSAEALASLDNGTCEVAGFHVPMGQFEAEALAHYGPWLDDARYRVIRLAKRRQGLMVAPGNPKRIYDVVDLARPDVRFINRQPGAGTRYLLDLMLQHRGIRADRIRGYEQCEYTHAAVAAFVASGMADAGFGVEVPAREFKLEFIPCEQERYYLLCHAGSLELPDVQRLLAVLRSDAYRAAVNALPGYAEDEAGLVQSPADIKAPDAKALILKSNVRVRNRR
jgi:molybdate transport repressor ModE-like protein